MHPVEDALTQTRDITHPKLDPYFNQTTKVDTI